MMIGAAGDGDRIVLRVVSVAAATTTTPVSGKIVYRVRGCALTAMRAWAYAASARTSFLTGTKGIVCTELHFHTTAGIVGP
jgi:hypothetical protein